MNLALARKAARDAQKYADKIGCDSRACDCSNKINEVIEYLDGQKVREAAQTRQLEVLGERVDQLEAELADEKANNGRLMAMLGSRNAASAEPRFPFPRS